RDPRFQALFAIGGVSGNVYKMSPDQIIGPKGNREFTDLTTVMGCNVGPKFDLSKLMYNKIIIASDADVDGFFIRSLLLAFFFKVFIEIILDGRLFIAEPPLYRVDDKKNPFVINMPDYIARYLKEATKYYRLGYVKIGDVDPRWLAKDEWTQFLADTSSYVNEMTMIAKHYNVRDRLLEQILEELVFAGYDGSNMSCEDATKIININKMIDRIAIEFPEVYYDEKRKVIRGIIDGRLQLLEINTPMIRKCTALVKIISQWGAKPGETLILKDVKTSTEHTLSLLGCLKILQKYQPNILHRFKGLGENDEADIRTTIMDPNTRSLIRVNVTDIENDMKIFQLLRGGTAQDLLGRKMMMREFQIDKDMIDT
ncbi:MAG: hypothetical protein K2N48_10475, partial [Muribaculaceae bacterium]|nr:hypothetical protein [Muribaculaceae bacterium]